MSRPLNIGLPVMWPVNCVRLVVWQVLQSRESTRIERASVTRFEPPWRSTVNASAGQPASRARFTSACVTSHWSVG
jgi:hypothetical protein